MRESDFTDQDPDAERHLTHRPSDRPYTVHLTARGRMYLDRHSENGLPGSSGAVGAPGRLTHVSATLDQALRGAYTTLVGGSNTFQGRLLATLSRSNQDGVVEYTLMACFDLETDSRLVESLSGDHGMIGTDGAEYSLTIVRREPPTT